MRDLRGRVALVTGASRGLGPYIAQALARAGMRLVLAARSAPDLAAVAARLAREGAQAVPVPADVGDRASLAALVAAAEQAFGRIDVLVNNAGIEINGPYHQVPPDEVERLLRVNLLGPMWLTQLVLPGMLARRQGHIVNMSSLAGKAGPPCAEGYAASKFGLVGFTQSLRAEYRPYGVSASVICPGFVEGTGMYHEMKQRTGVAAPPLLGTSRPEAVAAAVVRAIRRDLPEVIVNPVPIRPLAALCELFPRLRDATLEWSGAATRFRQRGAHFAR